MKNIYETEIFGKKNINHEVSWKKWSCFIKTVRFHIQKRLIQIKPYNRSFKKRIPFFLRKKNIKKYVTWNFNGNLRPFENCLVVFFNKLLKLRAVFQPKNSVSEKIETNGNFDVIYHFFYVFVMKHHEIFGLYYREK